MTTPIDALLGSGDAPPRCRVFAEDISVHWFHPGARMCLCGETESRADAWADDEDDE
jgi:hypothetical protein